MKKMEPDPSLVLENSFDLKQCIAIGSVLEINNVYTDVDCLENVLDNKLNIGVFGKPVPSFKDIEHLLECVNGEQFVKKQILEQGGGTALDEKFTVFIAYAGYFENVAEPFDCNSIHKPLKVDLKDNGLLPGLQMAIQSMKVGEYSMFLISYKVLYGILGAPPKIKPKTDCVYYIKLLKSIITPEDGVMDSSQPNMFERVSEEVKKLFKSGVKFYNNNNVQGSIQLFNKAISMMHSCRLANEKEQQFQEKILLKLYLNLAICYNQVKKPLKACVACNEINYLSSIWRQPKALLVNAQALRMIGDFSQATKRLKAAMTLDPGNEEIAEEMEITQKAQTAYEKYSKSNETDSNVVFDDFKTQIRKLLIQFRDDKNVELLKCHRSLNKGEEDYVKAISKELNIKCAIYEDTLSLNKMQEIMESYEFCNAPGEIL